MNKANILLVDDEAAFTRSLSRLLRVRGYDVTEVDNGMSAIRALGEENFDVVVLDLKMPGMDGFETLEGIKMIGSFVETLILTGHGSVDKENKAEKLGAYDFLHKPCELDHLLAKIEDALYKKGNRETKYVLSQMIRV